MTSLDSELLAHILKTFLIGNHTPATWDLSCLIHLDVRLEDQGAETGAGGVGKAQGQGPRSLSGAASPSLPGRLFVVQSRGSVKALTYENHPTLDDCDCRPRCPGAESAALDDESLVNLVLDCNVHYMVLLRQLAVCHESQPVG